MRPTYLTLKAVGNSKWVWLDYLQLAFGVGLGLSFSSNFTGSVNVQHTFGWPIDFQSLDQPGQGTHTVSWTQSASTTVTVTDNGPWNDSTVGHGLAVGDDVIIQNSKAMGLAGTLSGIDGEYTVVTVPSATTYTITVVPNQTATALAAATGLRVFNHASLNANTGTRADGNYAFPPRAVRLNATALSAGAAILEIIQGAGP